MRKGSVAWTRNSISLLLALLLVIMLALAQDNTYQAQKAKALNDAEQSYSANAPSDAQLGRYHGALDANTHWLNSLFWGAIAAGASVGLPLLGAKIFAANEYEVSAPGAVVGCLLGAAIGYFSFFPLVKPSPSAFVGKSPEYILAYTEAFRKKVKSNQGLAYFSTYAIIGVNVAAALLIVIGITSD